MASLEFNQILTKVGLLTATIQGGTGERVLTIYTVPSSKIGRVANAQNLNNLMYSITSSVGGGNSIPAFSKDLSGSWLSAGDSIRVHDTFDLHNVAATRHPVGYSISIEEYNIT